MISVAELCDRELVDDDACRSLWADVIQKARDDQRWLDANRYRTDLKKHELEKFRRIAKYPPQQFFESEWYLELRVVAVSS